MPYKEVNIQTIALGATVVNTEPIYGEIISIVVDYDVASAVGTDLVILNIDTPMAGVPNNVFTFNNNAADGCFYPRTECVDILGAAVDYDPLGGPPNCDVHDTMMACGRLSVSIAQAAPAATLNHTVYIIYKAESNQ